MLRHPDDVAVEGGVAACQKIAILPTTKSSPAWWSEYLDRIGATPRLTDQLGTIQTSHTLDTPTLVIDAVDWIAVDQDHGSRTAAAQQLEKAGRTGATTDGTALDIERHQGGLIATKGASVTISPRLSPRCCQQNSGEVGYCIGGW